MKEDEEVALICTRNLQINTQEKIEQEQALLMHVVVFEKGLVFIQQYILRASKF